MIIEELDRIKTKDGRIGTVLAKWFYADGLEIEFDDTAPQTETIDINDVSAVINRMDKIIWFYKIEARL